MPSRLICANRGVLKPICAAWNFSGLGSVAAIMQGQSWPCGFAGRMPYPRPEDRRQLHRPSTTPEPLRTPGQYHSGVHASCRHIGTIPLYRHVGEGVPRQLSYGRPGAALGTEDLGSAHENKGCQQTPHTHPLETTRHSQNIVTAERHTWRPDVRQGEEARSAGSICAGLQIKEVTRFAWCLRPLSISPGDSSFLAHRFDRVQGQDDETGCGC